METLSYRVLKQQDYQGYLLEDAPEKVLQFGEGNFLRAFVNYWFDAANEKAGWNGKCVLVQPIAQGLAKLINNQEGLYTLYLRGRENGEQVDKKRVVSSVSRCLDPYEKEGFDAMMALAVSDDLEYVVSNTTEAGIVYDPACKLEDAPAASFPGKLTQVLYKRWQAGKGGLIVLSCELIDKSCGCVQKGGGAQVVDVLDYGEAVTKKGLNLLSGPGNDLVSATALTAAGAHLILFTTGRGTPFGAPAPTVKISTNTALFEKKRAWIDFDAGTVARGESLDAAGDRLLDFVLEVAGGRRTRAEERGFREISIFKDAVVL